MNTIIYVPNTGTQTETIEAIMQIARSIDGKRKQRILFVSDVVNMMDKVDQYPDAQYIRSYSKHGFVARSYKWRADITYCYAHKNDDGTYTLGVAVCDAKRRYGDGALITVDRKSK